MKHYLLITLTLLLSIATVNGQSKKKNQVEEPIDESYQVVNVTREASVCYDTLTKTYDLVCYITQGNNNKTINIKLGKTWDEVAASLQMSMTNHNVKFMTVAKVLRYLMMERRMPAGNYSMSLDYVTPYSLKLNVNFEDYGFEKVPMTFALEDPKGGETFKDRIHFSGELEKTDIETIRSLINEEFIHNDVETGFFIIVLDGPAPEEEVVAAPEKPSKAKKDKAKKSSKKH